MTKRRTPDAKRSKAVSRPSARAPRQADRIVGENIRKLRLERKLTLSEFGGLLGISHQQLQKYETGQNRLSAGMLYSVAQILGIPIDDLFFDENAPQDDPATAEERRITGLQEACRSLVNRTSSLEKLLTIENVLKILS